MAAFSTSANAQTPPNPRRRPHPQSKRHSANPHFGAVTEETTERWEYKGRAWLVDIEVVVPMSLEDSGGEGWFGEEQSRLDVMSPEGSFVLYASEH
jgi:hypothetical protein